MMISARLRFAVTGLVLLVAHPAANALAADPDSALLQQRYQREIRPLVDKYCSQCHGAKEAKGEIALHRYADAEAVRHDRDTWEQVLEMVESQSMPPEDAPQPAAAERTVLVKWLESNLFFLDCNKPHDPGRVTIRRLNRAEYNNTIRDLLHVDLRPADDFPSDDVGHGFDNMGDVLSLPPLLFEKYMDAAEQVAAAAIVAGDPSSAQRQQREREELQAQGSARLDDYGVYNLHSSGTVSGQFQFPRDGRYALRVAAGAQQAGSELAKMQLRLDRTEIKTFEVQAPPDQHQQYEVVLRVQKGSRRLSASFINDYYNPQSPNPRDRDRNLFIQSLEVIGPLDLPESELPTSHKRIITTRPGPNQSIRQSARDVLAPLLSRAFRRDVGDDELAPFVRLVEVAGQRGETFERGVQLAVTAMLVSPHFLFRVERDPDANDPAAKHPLNDFELASRLSYFLWSSMPDEELFQLARQRQLHRSDVLDAQVRRMLQDPKADALVENFGGQWLNLRNLDDITPDPAQFAAFDERLRDDMRRETWLFFAAVMREDRSVMDFVDGDFTFVNQRLARHYGLPGVTGPEFRRVALSGSQRCGVLTQGSILTLTSNPTRTSPVKRGKWIMENILGTPPPDPPANVPELAETQKAAPNASLREQLEIHRESESCAVCHRQMDALGFGLENFDAIGRWRERDGEFAVDASGILPGGERFDGPRQLVSILSKRKREFSRSLTEKMLCYALGRGLEFYDRCAVDKIVQALERKDYRFSVLVSGIVKSEPFLMRRGEEGDTP